MKLLFLPAIRLLDRLSYPLKFGLIILVCAAASAVLLTQIFTNLRSEIRVTHQEIAGLELFDAGFVVTSRRSSTADCRPACSVAARTWCPSASRRRRS